jgi:predicted 3-demethylubiquinone-9 3-methyltransferase (glyoxalase superfamily)
MSAFEQFPPYYTLPLVRQLRRKCGQCGWLKDKFGLSWQIVPARLPDLVKQPKAMQAMLKMKKRDITALERAAGSNE